MPKQTIRRSQNAENRSPELWKKELDTAIEGQIGRSWKRGVCSTEPGNAEEPLAGKKLRHRFVVIVVEVKVDLLSHGYWIPMLVHALCETPSKKR